jgi:hypothetical protein
VELKVKPERMKQKDQAAKERWWQFLRPRGALYAAIRGYQNVLVQSFPSKYLALAFVPSHVVVAAPHCVFALERYSHFAALQSRVHEIWTLFFGSTQEDRLRYTITGYSAKFVG